VTRGECSPRTTANKTASGDLAAVAVAFILEAHSVGNVHNACGQSRNFNNDFNGQAKNGGKSADNEGKPVGHYLRSANQSSGSLQNAYSGAKWKEALPSENETSHARCAQLRRLA
jgi:hypothetical protein